MTRFSEVTPQATMLLEKSSFGGQDEGLMDATFDLVWAVKAAMFAEADG